MKKATKEIKYPMIEKVVYLRGYKFGRKEKRISFHYYDSIYEPVFALIGKRKLSITQNTDKKCLFTF